MYYIVIIHSSFVGRKGDADIENGFVNTVRGEGRKWGKWREKHQHVYSIGYEMGSW